ncbi:MAG: agmatinase family protein [Phycisphaerae bacterium]|nr:agmatinase family protein [Phycisphaerae bacterium]
MAFDPNAPAAPGSGIFGLPTSRDQSRVIIVPVPFDATTSYQSGAALGPSAVLRASAQVDLLDHHFGRVYEHGIFLEPEPDELVNLFAKTRVLAEPIIAKGGAEASDAEVMEQINKVGEEVNALTYGAFAALLGDGKSPGLLGGDHSTPFGAIQACADLAEARDPKGGLGILHLDAHMDLRAAYEGFAWSHASIMHNVLERTPEVKRVVQIGIRDYSDGEVAYAKSQGQRVRVHYDADWAARRMEGATYASLVREALKPLPKHVYVTFDIDALDPSLCPHTGTPVPGGLSFNEAAYILRALADTGRTVLGFDLVEVAPGRVADEPELDANVGARVLYKLCGLVGERGLRAGGGAGAGRASATAPRARRPGKKSSRASSSGGRTRSRGSKRGRRG